MSLQNLWAFSAFKVKVCADEQLAASAGQSRTSDRAWILLLV